MHHFNKRILLWLTALVSVVNFAVGLYYLHPLLLGVGSIGMTYVVLAYWGQRAAPNLDVDEPPSAELPLDSSQAVRTAVFRTTAGVPDTESLVEEMLAQGRYSLLLRPQIIANLTEPQKRRALEALRDGVSLVPEGEVVLGHVDDALEDGRLEDEEIASHRAIVVRVEPIYLDRYPVTNRQYYEFVRAGGYEQMAVWDPVIWPAVIDFVDRTGHPGPRWWARGKFASGEENLPVVGVGWYEATAYARWIGKRLPSDAEWTKAGCWPVPLSMSCRLQRRYPWGNSMEPRRANLWGNGPGRIVRVDEFSEGVSVGGAFQLIGNVWEWMSGDYEGRDELGNALLLPVPMKSLRGGAFDTYFETQATCQFVSGENPVARKHNIGFRCAVGLCDLAPHVPLAVDENLLPESEGSLSSEPLTEAPTEREEVCV